MIRSFRTNFPSITTVAVGVALMLADTTPAQLTRYRDLIFTSATTTRNITYGSAVNRHSNRTETLRLDLYQPAGDRAATRAAIVIVHGGGFVGGDKGTNQFRRMGTDFAQRGFVAISINYRLAPNVRVRTQADITAAGHDMKAAVRWLRKNAKTYRIDTNRIGCTGGSAGAITCCEAAYVPGEGSSGNPGFSSKVHAVVELWGGLTDLKQLDKGEAPVMIIHGTRDSVVPYKNATDLKKQADAVGVPAELFPLNAGHSPWNLYYGSYHSQHAVPFFYKWLRLGQLSGLRARPGFASPGTLTIDVFGNAGAPVLLALGLGQTNTPVPPLGTLCIFPIVQLYPVTTLPSSPRISRATFNISVPSGIKGDGYWQAVVGNRFTNCVTTSFR